MNNRLSIQIPYDLARYVVWQRKVVTRYQTNRVIKAIDTWLVLKAETRSSLLQNWNLQKSHLFSICKVTESIFRSRLQLLKQLDLISYDRHNIRLCSWDHLAATFEIDITKKFTVQYDVTNSQRVQEWLIATEIKDNQNRQAYAVVKKLNENPGMLRSFTSAVLKAGADPARIKDPGYLLSWLQILYRQDFIQASEIHDLLIETRPDTNRGVLTMTDHWKAKHPTLVTYWKKILAKTGIADITKLQIQSEQRVRNQYCKVLWLDKPKETLLCLCDNIQILEPWIILTTLCKDSTDNADTSNSNLSAA